MIIEENTLNVLHFKKQFKFTDVKLSASDFTSKFCKHYLMPRSTKLFGKSIPLTLETSLLYLISKQDTCLSPLRRHTISSDRLRVRCREAANWRSYSNITSYVTHGKS